MVTAYSNGKSNGHSSNGHNKRKPEQPEIEASQPKPCALRLGGQSWCYLPDKHDGDHEGVPPVYGPVEERPKLWRRHRGQIK